jgi:tetratricopeptide (TPR) repeat protein
MTDTAPPFALYNPGLLPPDILLSEFTARRPLLARLLDIIRTNELGEPPQHMLVVGARGMGKTTLLCAIAASIELHEPELKKDWQPVVFDEESRRIGDLADFWLECIRQWESTTEPSLTSSQRIDALLDQPAEDIEDQARDTFLKLVDGSGKRALLLIDNLNDVLLAVNDHESLMRLRSFLMSDDRVMIVGAATQWFSAVANVDKPFFEFFRGFDLQALSLEEMRESLAGVAEARGDQQVLDNLKTNSNRIEALHILTGGNPRLIRTFYRLLNEGMNGELRQQLERLIDDYTPYHKAIIDALPGQQQRVLDAIALQWNPCDVATVARITRLPSNQVSAQIRALSKANLVSEVPAMGTLKKKAYLLTDRFSNIHYLMRHGRAGQLRMHWFVMTLRVLFDDEEFADAAATTVRLTAAGGSGMERDGLELAHAALDCAGTDQARRRLFDRVVGSPEFDDEVNVEFAEKLCRESIARNAQDPLARYKWGRLLAVHLKRFDEAEAAFREAIKLDPKYGAPWNGLANLLTDVFGRHGEAETAHRKAIELDPKDARMWYSLGILLTEVFGRHDEAEAAYRKAIELDPNLGLPHSDLARRLGETGQHDEESKREASLGLKLKPGHGLVQNVFRDLCFSDANTLQATLPEVSLWCSQHPDEKAVVSFLVYAWLALAQVTTAADALTLLEAQPAEVRLVFESLSDALIAHDNQDHLHRLAPERRAPVLKLLERLTPYTD